MSTFRTASLAMAIFLSASISSFAQENFTANLTHDQEPPPAGTTPTLTSTGDPRPVSFGDATLILSGDQTRLSLRVTVYNIDITGSQTPDTNDNLSAAHIHAPAPPGQNAGVRWGFFGTPDNDNNPDNLVVAPFADGVGGTFQSVWNAPEGNAGTTLAAQLENIRNGLAYLNFHTVQFGGGEIRGQILAATPTPSPTPSPSPSPSPSASPSPSPSNSPSQTLNISTRARVETGERVMIAGAIVTGNAPKRVIVRALGPSLSAEGVADALADPVLQLHGPDGAVIATNDNWKDTQQPEINSSNLAPTDDRESAIVASLAPANYTAIVTGKNGTSGIALAEIYDLDRAADSRLANISTRGLVRTGENVMIGGFMLGGGTSNTNVIVRGLGPSLAQAGVSNALSDPTLELRNSNGTIVLTNDDWGDDASQAAAISASGLAPTDQRESAIAATLPPGDYTATLAGKNATTGIGLVEIYNRSQ